MTNRVHNLMHRPLREIRKASRYERIMNRAWCWLVASGLVPESWPGQPKIGSVVLELIGRRSGRPRPVPITWIELEGIRYLVAMLGEELDWVHNARAAAGKVVIKRGRRRHAKLEELPVDERAPVLKAWLGRTGMSSIPRKYLGVDRQGRLEDFERIAPRWPVFRMVRS